MRVINFGEGNVWVVKLEGKENSRRDFIIESDLQDK